MLTDIKIKNAKPEAKIYKIYDAEGLYLEVPPTGKKRWRLKYRFGGVEKRISLGVYPDISLREARVKRDEARQQVADGKDPSPRQQLALRGQESFEAVAHEWIAKRGETWSDRHRETTLQRLSAYIFPQFGRRPIGELGPLDVLNALRIVEKRGALEAARKTLGICSLIFRYAIASARIASDPCRDLKGALATRPKGHYGAITDPTGAGALMRAIEAYHGAAVVRCALLFAAYTFVRPGELRAAEWIEFDLDAAEWTIPAEKMKMRKEHKVPLSKQALRILDEVRNISEPEAKYVFQSVRRRSDRILSENTLLVALRAMGYERGQMTAHGFRSMASSLLNEIGWRPDVIERQLAHTDKDKIRGAYNRTEYLNERREMMQAWADYLDSLRDSSHQQ